MPFKPAFPGSRFGMNNDTKSGFDARVSALLATEFLLERFVQIGFFLFLE